MQVEASRLGDGPCHYSFAITAENELLSDLLYRVARDTRECAAAERPALTDAL